MTDDVRQLVERLLEQVGDTCCGPEASDHEPDCVLQQLRLATAAQPSAAGGELRERYDRMKETALRQAEQAATRIAVLDECASRLYAICDRYADGGLTVGIVCGIADEWGDEVDAAKRPAPEQPGEGK